MERTPILVETDIPQGIDRQTFEDALVHAYRFYGNRQPLNPEKGWTEEQIDNEPRMRSVSHTDGTRISVWELGRRGDTWRRMIKVTSGDIDYELRLLDEQMPGSMCGAIDDMTAKSFQVIADNFQRFWEDNPYISVH